MATSVPDVQRAMPQLSPKYLDRLERLASSRGWTLDSAMQHALDIADVILEAEDDPKSEVYVYKRGRRYSLRVKS